MLDDAGMARELGGERLRVGDRAERAVEDQVALVGAERAGGITIAPHDDGRTQLLDREARRREPEVDDLDGEREARAEALGALRRVDDDHLACARLRDELLAEQRAATALDEVELRVDLVGAVDRDVDLPRHVVGEQRDPDAPGLVRGLDRGRHADDVGQLTAREQRTDATGGVDRGRAGAEPDDHAGLHLVGDRALRGGALQIVDVGQGATRRAAAAACGSRCRGSPCRSARR